MMRAEWRPRRLELWSGDRVADFAVDPRPFDRVHMFLRTPAGAVEALVRAASPDHDLVVNIENSPEAKRLAVRFGIWNDDQHAPAARGSFEIMFDEAGAGC